MKFFVKKTCFATTDVFFFFLLIFVHFSAKGLSVKMAQSCEGPDQILEANTYVTTDINGSVKLRMAQSGPGSEQPVSVPHLLQSAAKMSPNHPALCVKRNDNWVKWTYSEYLTDVEKVSRAFIQLGLDERRSVAIMGFNSPEWFMSDLAAIFCNSVAVGIYPTNSPEATK